MLEPEVIWSICGVVVFILMCAAAVMCFLHERKRQRRHDQLLENLTQATHPQFTTPKSPWATDTSGEILTPPTSAFHPRLSLVPNSQDRQISAVGPHIPGSHIPMMVSHGVPTAAGNVYLHNPSIASTRDRMSGPRVNPLRSPETIQHRSHMASERRASDERPERTGHQYQHHRTTDERQHDVHGHRTSVEAASRAHAHQMQRSSADRQNHRFSVDNQNRVIQQLPNDRTKFISSDTASGS